MLALCALLHASSNSLPYPVMQRNNDTPAVPQSDLLSFAYISRTGGRWLDPDQPAHFTKNGGRRAPRESQGVREAKKVNIRRGTTKRDEETQKMRSYERGHAAGRGSCVRQGRVSWVVSSPESTAAQLIRLTKGCVCASAIEQLATKQAEK